MKAAYCKYILHFKQPATTSRAVMTEKETYFLKIWDEKESEKYGLGECSIFRGLSAEDTPEYESKLSELCHGINTGTQVDISGFSSIRFGLETALMDFQNGGRHNPFPTAWSRGEETIPINGLVWMGSAEEMTTRVAEKIEAGFRCLKFKIGGLDFNEELRIIDNIRQKYPPSELEIRLDANGSFSPSEAMDKLKRLAVLDIHSIEQPIKPGQLTEMAYLCENSPIPIALDEELIGIDSNTERQKLLYCLNPAFIILKPSLCGGFSGAAAWVEAAENRNIGWWVTSALESNVGLNAIAQWASTFYLVRPQGLGTGQLYLNNIPSPLEQIADTLAFDPEKSWIVPDMEWLEP